ncbi:MarR family winged helix-turn-helix transcriptional regulator [Paenibacillus wynnii]|uniref:HTH marR-type domain-containing protein n=1 Tax=Paenibacillus wynnii TaxID=268407 RepID=A0A098MFK0_9BACL|nr:MarR family transcriptional regulator [Paenibacillus wynnii]KGE20307.1 hypothetical protein PWYN_13905 [Paenibacillus wynnii]
MNDENTVAHKLMIALRQLHRAQWQRSSEGNKPSEMTLMLSIGRHMKFKKEGPKVSEISRYLGLTPPTVTQLINSLEAKSMVERQADPTDRRVVRVLLTEQGKAVTRRAMVHRDASLQKLVEYLGEEESNQLADLLLKVHQFAQENPPPDLDRLQMNGDEKLD